MVCFIIFRVDWNAVANGPRIGSSPWYGFGSLWKCLDCVQYFCTFLNIFRSRSSGLFRPRVIKILVRLLGAVHLECEIVPTVRSTSLVRNSQSRLRPAIVRTRNVSAGHWMFRKLKQWRRYQSLRHFKKTDKSYRVQKCGGEENGDLITDSASLFILNDTW